MTKSTTPSPTLGCFTKTAAALFGALLLGGSWPAAAKGKKARPREPVIIFRPDNDEAPPPRPRLHLFSPLPGTISKAPLLIQGPDGDLREKPVIVGPKHPAS